MEKKHSPPRMLRKECDENQCTASLYGCLCFDFSKFIASTRLVIHIWIHLVWTSLFSIYLNWQLLQNCLWSTTTLPPNSIQQHYYFIQSRSQKVWRRIQNTYYYYYYMIRGSCYRRRPDINVLHKVRTDRLSNKSCYNTHNQRHTRAPARFKFIATALWNDDSRIPLKMLRKCSAVE